MSKVWDGFRSLLLRRGVVSRQQLEEADLYGCQRGVRFDVALVQLGYATARDMLQVAAEYHGLEAMDLTAVTVAAPVFELMPESVARENAVFPVAEVDRTLVIAIADPWDLDTLTKVRFILNRNVRVVLALREQILEAINRHYGQTETGSVDSCLIEFTDTAIDLDLGPASRPAPTPRPPRAEPSRVERHATVRYYHRMNPQRMFPLLVVLSDRAVRAVAKQGVSQGQSKVFTADLGSLVEIEPVLPGCNCYPPRQQVQIGAAPARVTFWVVPHVLGQVMDARVVVRQDNTVLAEVPLEARVVRQGVTLAMGGMSLLLPFLLAVLKQQRLDFESQAADGFSLYTRLAGWAVQALSPEVLTVLLLAATAALYLWLRPRKRDVFWDLEMLGKAAPPNGELLAPPPPDDQEALLAHAKGHFQRKQYETALRLYEKGLAQGPAAADYLRASLAAHALGDNLHALAILQRAEAELPAAAMTGPMWYNMGCFATRLGRFSDALRYLHRAVDTGYAKPEMFREDPDLEPLRWRKDFKRLLATLPQ